MTLLLNPGPATGGQAVRSVTKSGEEVQIVAIDTAELPGGAMPVTGTFWQATQPVSGTFFQATQPVSFTWAGLTDTELRATAVPVSGPLTDTQLRATAVPVSAASLPLPTGAATETTLATVASRLPTLGQKEREGSMSFTLSSDDEALLGNILQALAPLMSARGTDGALRIQSQGGTLTTITTVGTVTTVTTVATVTTVGTVSNVANQTAIGGLQAVPHIPALMNIAAASNIDRMVG
jgi:hypothetical protein